MGAIREGFPLNGKQHCAFNAKIMNMFLTLVHAVESVGIIYKLKVIPTDVLRKCIFEKASIAPDDLINILVTDCSRLNSHMDTSALQKRHKEFFEDHLKGLIKDRAKIKPKDVSEKEKEKGMKCGEEFLRLFLDYCTDSHCIPSQQIFLINGKFNKDVGEDRVNVGRQTLTSQRFLLQ